MASGSQEDQDRWINSWLDSVRDGRATMSQRTLSSVEKHATLEKVTSAARSRGVHLVELTDDKGRKLVAASRHPIKTLC